MTTITADALTPAEIRRLSLADGRDFTGGTKVKIHNPMCDPGWKTTGTVVAGREASFFMLDTLGLDGMGVFVVPDDGPFAGQTGWFAKVFLTIIDEDKEGPVVAHDADGLRALPLQSVVRDNVGDTLRKEPEGWRYLSIGGATLADGVPHFTSEVIGGSSIYSPWVVEEADFDEPTPVFETGDEVLVTEGTSQRGYFLYIDDFNQEGERATVIAAYGPNLYYGTQEYQVHFPERGYCKLATEAQLSRYVKIEDVLDESTEDEIITVHDVEGFDALPYGSVVQDVEFGGIAVRAVDGYVRPQYHSFPLDSDDERATTVTTVFPSEYLMDDSAPQRVLFLADVDA